MSGQERAEAGVHKYVPQRFTPKNRALLGCDLKSQLAGSLPHGASWQGLPGLTRVRSPPWAGSGASPFSKECAAGVLDALQLQEARAHQQRLHVLLVNGKVAVVGEVDQSLQGARERRKEPLQRLWPSLS